MIKHGIILEHVILNKETEVDKAKIDFIANLPPPNLVKDIRSFLEYVNFYWCSIKNFSKISRSLTNFLVEDVPFEFTS